MCRQYWYYQKVLDNTKVSTHSRVWAHVVVPSEERDEETRNEGLPLFTLLQ